MSPVSYTVPWGEGMMGRVKVNIILPCVRQSCWFVDVAQVLGL